MKYFLIVIMFLISCNNIPPAFKSFETIKHVKQFDYDACVEYLNMLEHPDYSDVTELYCLKLEMDAEQ